MEQKAKEAASHAAIPVSISAMLVTLGVVYGDIGTSPMYVTKALVAGNGGIGSVTEEFVLGALSLVVWTVTLLTTIKYVLISLRADNHGEGGIFALYSLVKRCGKWLIIPAMLGGAALLADGILTPAVTVTTAIEGLRTIEWGHALLGRVVAITLAIIIALFLVQRIGTAKIGHAFGPIMTLWFLFLGGTGLFFVFQHPAVLLCLNPVRGIAFLLSPNNHAGIMILGSCFLATTGAEALYSDMGHVGRGNIYATWPFVKCCLLLSYMGQGAWLMNNAANPELMGIADLNPFYQMLAGAYHRRILAGVRGQPSGPYAAHAGLLPCRDQGPALHPHGQQRHACGLRHRGAAVPELGAYGSRLRPCHYADYDVHHAAALLLPA